jgi:hypothetical protein
MWLHLLKLSTLFYKERSRYMNAKNYHSIHFDTQTKVSVLKDTLSVYLKSNDPEEAISSSRYAQTIIEDLKKDYQYDTSRLDLVHELQQALDCNNEKDVKRIVRIL